LLAAASGWIAFYLVDQALYNGFFASRVAAFLATIVTAFIHRQSAMALGRVAFALQFIV
jgi:hypothetical protein